MPHKNTSVGFKPILSPVKENTNKEFNSRRTKTSQQMANPDLTHQRAEACLRTTSEGNEKSLQTAISAACKAAKRLDSFLEKARPVSENTEGDDYQSITSELLHLRAYEDELRRELDNIGLDDSNDPSRLQSMESACSDDVSCAEDDLPIELASTQTPLGRGKSTSRSSWLLPQIAPASPQTVSTVSTDDMPLPVIFTTKPIERQRDSEMDNSVNESFGLYNQISESELLSLEEDLEAAFVDFRTSAKREQHSEKATSLIWGYILRLAEFLYGKSENSIEAKIESRLIAMGYDL